MKGKSKWIWGAICFSAIVAVIFVFSFRRAILLEAGRFMAPEVNQIEGVIDVVILEGEAFIGRDIVSKGVDLVTSGKARRMVDTFCIKFYQITCPLPFMKTTTLQSEGNYKALVCRIRLSQYL